MLYTIKALYQKKNYVIYSVCLRKIYVSGEEKNFYFNQVIINDNQYIKKNYLSYF